MENNFDNRDFERMVRQHADQFRMFPSDRVWKGVENALHRRRRWYGIGLALLLVTTGVVTMVMLTPSEKSEFARLGRNASFTMGVPLRSIAAVPATLVQAPSTTDPGSTKTFPSALAQNYFTQSDLAGNTNKELTGIETDELVNHYRDETEPATALVIEKRPTAITRPASISRPDHIFKNLGFLSKAPVIDQNEYVGSALPLNSDATDLFLAASSTKKHTDNEIRKENRLALPPYTIESVVNSYRHTKGHKKLNWLLYLTPTISYRTLMENTEFISAARYNSIMSGAGNNTNPVFYSTDVNSVVQHRPDLGMQFGVRAGLPLSQWFSLTGGLQLGISKYDIRASETNAEVGTIALTTRNTLNPVSNFRNEEGARENWLRNFYFSASVPIGMELKLSDGSKNYFGIATTLQPTFVLDNRAYLITTDYKNYAEVPSLTRKFNMNTSFEIFTAHTTGKVQWRVGPQIHYQLMSSFNKNYPIKEHLFDFGLKLGIQLK
jgi:hypothetical protein